MAGLIVLATIGFVIGTSIERHNSSHESAAQLRAEGAGSKSAGTGEGSESAATHAAEGETKESTEGAAAPKESGEEAHAAETHSGTSTESHKELRPLGVDIEAVPFIVLAALASLALAALGWMRPRWLLGLAAIAVAMIVFGALDVREAFHQSDENQTGLVILAAVIAALHFAAAGVAAVMARRDGPGTPAAAGTIPA
ncbi:MAG TPA: hypothetical protein VF257_07755 [Solirubrobacteraceae bacterium]